MARPSPPDAVVFPETTAEVSAIVTACARARAPIVPFGMGSSLEGHVNAVRGGVTLDLTRMNHVCHLSTDELDVVVEAGMTHRRLNDHLKNTGLMFPVDPGADATIGGMTARNTFPRRSSGQRAIRKRRRDVRLQRRLVLAEPHVAPLPEDRRLRIGGELRARPF